MITFPRLIYQFRKMVCALALLAAWAPAGAAMTLATALANPHCQVKVAAVEVLRIAADTPCSKVSVAPADGAASSAAAPLKPVVIDTGGQLQLLDPGTGNSTTLYASSFLIKNGGSMQAGTPTKGIQNHITIIMAGNASVSPSPSADPTANVRDITVMDGGVLALYGAKGLSALPDQHANNPAQTPAFINAVSGTRSWAYLAVPAGPSATYNDAANVSAPVPTGKDNLLTLSTQVDWQPGDWIAVATTSFSSHQTEIVQVCKVQTAQNPDPQASKLGLPAQVSQVTLSNGANCTDLNNTPLKHYHFGGLTPTPGSYPAGTQKVVAAGGQAIDVSLQARSFYDGPERNYGIDERAAVALLSRNITLTSVAGQAGDALPYTGGHLVAMLSGTGKPAPTLQLVGVEIAKFGQGVVGRYPVHLHHLGKAPANAVLVQDVSVHHSYNKCFVLHHTGNTDLFNNSCVRTVGQGVYLEDGAGITGNQLMRNLVAGAMAARATYSYPRSPGSLYWDGDYMQASHSAANWYTIQNIPDTSATLSQNKNPIDANFPGGFWITNLANTFVNNTVAGCQAQGRGYWLLAQGGAEVRSAYPEFTGNRAHACFNGIDNDDQSGNTQDAQPTLNGPSAYAAVLLLNDNTVTRSRQAGLWMRSNYVTVHNSRFAANLHGVSLLVGGGPEGTFPGFWGLVHQSVFAGMTRNNVERYPACANAANNWMQECTDVALLNNAWGIFPNPKFNSVGYSYYDGPARIEHNRFINFRADPTSLYPSDPAARLLTVTDIGNIATYGVLGQLEGPPAIDGKTTSMFNGYVGDAATAWQQSNAQSVPPTQYIRNSIWENTDFKHQVYTDDVNLGALNDGDKTTVILDKDSQLSGLRIVDRAGNPAPGLAPVSLNNLAYYATSLTVDEPHARGPNNFRASALMSPHKYATLNVESVINPVANFRLRIQRDMQAADQPGYPSLLLYGRGGQPIFEPFVMDRMGYTLLGATGFEHSSPQLQPAAFMPTLLLSYTDSPVRKAGEFFINRIAIYQPTPTPAQISVSRIRRQWGGQQYGASPFPPAYNAPGGAATSCDNVFNQNQGAAAAKWQDCLNRAANAAPYNAAPYTELGYPYGKVLSKASGKTPAEQWANFQGPYLALMKLSKPTKADIQAFIDKQSWYYDTQHQTLYFYMLEDQPVQHLASPYGTCGGGASQYAAQLARTQQLKPFSDPATVKAALDASCLVAKDEPGATDLFICGSIGCAAYLVDFGVAAPLPSPAACGSCAPAYPVMQAEFERDNQYHFVYGTPSMQPNGLPVAGNPAIGNSAPPPDGSALSAIKSPKAGLPPPAGNRITYSFQPMNAGVVPVTQDFPYQCLLTPPWSPANIRGGYPPASGFTYPLHPTVCEKTSR
ncbi:G8 domain-containing protein [Duganella sp. sic0402]|uniref:G8 domain-containing protein n=1 Tax=Duganella sp. sic0402 TaxID=2854786 RepID=UPI001C481BD2|nr:G8 domain-containing protein [Duganella sp. sic0402]MBV7534707.1 G8 domain-containing protein [Duganella sp. sic0402]